MNVKTLNKVTLIGVVVRRPESNVTNSGVPVSTFYLMTDRTWAKGDEVRSSSMSHACVAWARMSTLADEMLDVGDLVYVEGRLETKIFKSYDTDENGEPIQVQREISEIVVGNMIVLRKAGEDFSADFEEDLKERLLSAGVDLYKRNEGETYAEK